MLTLWHVYCNEKFKPISLENCHRKSVVFCFMLLLFNNDLIGFVKIFINLCTMNSFTALIEILTLEEETFSKMSVHSNLSYPFQGYQKLELFALEAV